MGHARRKAGLKSAENTIDSRRPPSAGQPSQTGNDVRGLQLVVLLLPRQRTPGPHLPAVRDQGCASAHLARSVLGSWVKPCGARVGIRKGGNGRRTPTQDPSTCCPSLSLAHKSLLRTSRGRLHARLHARSLPARLSFFLTASRMDLPQDPSAGHQNVLCRRA